MNRGSTTIAEVPLLGLDMNLKGDEAMNLHPR